MEFIVTSKSMRPASNKEQCFYCKQKIGSHHNQDCVLINKKVKVRMIVEYEIEVPNHWDKEDIEFHRNDGSWCADNAIDELQEKFNNPDSSCMCLHSKFEYLGENSEPFIYE
jgi:hypothetical protein